GWSERRSAAGEAGAAKRGTREAHVRPAPRRRRTCRVAYRLVLRNVYRAGFAGRGTPSGLSIEPQPRSPSRPDTESRVGYATCPSSGFAPGSDTARAARRAAPVPTGDRGRRTYAPGPGTRAPPRPRSPGAPTGRARCPRWRGPGRRGFPGDPAPPPRWPAPACRIG